jgi:hypothetical protein
VAAEAAAGEAAASAPAARSETRTLLIRTGWAGRVEILKP